MTVSVDVRLGGGRDYEVRIGPGLLSQAGQLIRPLLKRDRISIVTEENVAHAQLARLEAALNDVSIDHNVLILEPGEKSKSWSALETTVEWLLEKKVERDDVIVALGGGVIGDLAGFAASVVRRGMRFVQVPTSLLAQVDSSVGGKTGINARHGKNLVGAFHQPSLVLADVDVLSPLCRSGISCPATARW